MNSINNTTYEMVSINNRVYIEKILDILVKFDTFTVGIYDEFQRFIYLHINWISSLNYDVELYNSRNKEKILVLRDFLRYPEEHLEDFIDYFRDYIIIKASFKNFKTKDGIQSMNEYFTEIVSELDYILERMPPSNYDDMKEKNKNFYQDLNKYIMNPKRIEKMALQFHIDFFDYLDLIDI